MKKGLQLIFASKYRLEDNFAHLLTICEVRTECLQIICVMQPEHQTQYLKISSYLIKNSLNAGRSPVCDRYFSPS